MNGHVTRAGFGLHIDIFEKMIEYVMELKKEGPLDPWEIPYFIRNFYDQVFQISDRCYMMRDRRHELKSFDTNTNPLRMVSKTVREDLLESSQYRKRAWEYRIYKIHEVQGMSFKEWLEQPPYLLDAILNDIRAEEEAKQRHLHNENNAIDQLGLKGDMNKQIGDSLFRNSKSLR